MSGLLILVIAMIVLGAAYLIYGRYLEKTWGIDPNAKTPAYAMQDGVDYVPADKGVVFGHQFASIAGAGPINGPIQAAIFGWVPVLLWILLGGIFFGAVQDFVSMYASVKSKGRTIGYIIELYMGRLGKQMFLLFTWLFSILVVAAFADIVAETFDGFTAQGAHEAANGAVATTSLLFIAAAVGLGVLLKSSRFSTMVNTLIAVGLLVLCVALGLVFPIFLSKGFWLYFVFAYIFVASVLPVWALLQPRDYLNSYLLLAMLAGAVVGIVCYNPTIHLPTFTSFHVDGQYLFPALFVTIACGAVSGFHSLVSSGTSSKQIKNEKDMLPVSFGAMLVESLLAVIALVTVGFLATGGGVLPSGTPAQVFSQAIAVFLEKVGLPQTLSYTIITLAVSAFALTSLDSVARIGRLAFQEFFSESDDVQPISSPMQKILTSKYTATICTLLMGYALAISGYKNIWPLFGSANQMLAALALIACAVFLKKTNRKGFMLWLPMLVMLAVTFCALTLKLVSIFNLMGTPEFVVMRDGLQLVFAVLLFILGVIVAFQGLRKLTEKTDMQKVA